MASRHDRNSSPVRNALLKWQLRQDQDRLREVQKRLMRMAAPSPASSLGVDSRRPTVRRLRPQDHTDPEEDALMSLLIEREQQEATISNQNEVLRSRLKYPSVLPPLRCQNKPPLDSAVQKGYLRPTGQKLNAAGDFYSPVRPRESAANSSTSDCRQNLAFSRIKAPTSKRLVAAIAAPSPRNLLHYDQMKTPDRWRTTAMQSNQDELGESIMRRWEQEDVAQADRLLEKAARDGDDEALWNDLFYGNKAKTNQQPVIYSTSNFHDEKVKLKAEEELLTSELSTLSTTKPSTAQHSEIGAPVTDSNGATAPSSTQTIAELFASMEKGLQTKPFGDGLVAGGDGLVAGGDGGDDSSSGGEAKEEFSANGLSANFGDLFNAEFPRWGVILVVCCVVIGSGGFFIEELMALMGLLSKNTLFVLSKAEQERMRGRVNSLHLELQGFQHSTSEIQVKSQTVLTELQRYMDRMKVDREKHQNMLAIEMQELRRHILNVTHELVEKERESLQSQLQEMVKLHVSNEDSNTIDVEMEKEFETPSEEHEETLIKQLPHHERDESVMELTSDSDSDTQSRQLDDKSSQEMVFIPVLEEVAEAIATDSSSESSPDTNSAQFDDERSQEEVVERVKSSLDTIVHVDSIVETSNTQVIHRTPVEADHVTEIDQSGNKLDILITSAPEVTIITKSRPSASGMSWDGILLLIGIMFLVACILLRVYNINRRKRWFEARRRRRNHRALLFAQQRARTMAATQDDSDEWDDDETDDRIEEVSLMTPLQDSEDETASEEQEHSPHVDTAFHNENEGTSIPTKTSSLHFRQRKPRQRQHREVQTHRRGDI